MSTYVRSICAKLRTTNPGRTDKNIEIFIFHDEILTVTDPTLALFWTSLVHNIGREMEIKHVFS